MKNGIVLSSLFFLLLLKKAQWLACRPSKSSEILIPDGTTKQCIFEWGGNAGLS